MRTPAEASEIALAYALACAVEAQRWDVVAELAHALAARTGAP